MSLAAEKYGVKVTEHCGFDGWVMVEQDTHKCEPKLNLAENMAVLKKQKNN